MRYEVHLYRYIYITDQRHQSDALHKLAHLPTATLAKISNLPPPCRMGWKNNILISMAKSIFSEKASLSLFLTVCGILCSDLHECLEVLPKICGVGEGGGERG